MGRGSGPATAASLLPAAGGAAPAPRGLYLHVPFCVHKCHYCDFYSIVDGQDRQGAFVSRMLGEIEAARVWLARPLETIFAGGGTPTLLAAGLWEALLAALGTLPRVPDVEFTVEANPETVSAELLRVLVAGGVNRMSLGAQSFDRRHLKTLERLHDPPSVSRSVGLARAAGIDNVNLDLIFAIPGQRLDEWLTDLDGALALEPSHLSCYGLTYEPNTPLTARLRRGEFARADEDLGAEMYLAAVERLGTAGFEHYEISNWARPGRRCRHNLLYWMDEAWWALGPGASGHLDGARWRNVPRLGEYLDSSGLPPVVDAERLDEDGRGGEALMLRLRLIEGIELNGLESLLARGRRGAARRAALDSAESSGLLERAAGRLRFTRRGLLLADSVLCELV